MSKKEKIPDAYKEFFKNRKFKISLKSLISDIENCENTLVNKSEMGLINEEIPDKTIREEVMKKFPIGLDNASISLYAPAQIAKGKDKILALNYEQAVALGIIYGINLFGSPDSISCTVSTPLSHQKSKATLKYSSEIPYNSDFLLISKALAKEIDFKNKGEIFFENIKLNPKRVNLDKTDNVNSNQGCDY